MPSSTTESTLAIVMTAGEEFPSNAGLAQAIKARIPKIVIPSEVVAEPEGTLVEVKTGAQCVGIYTSHTKLAGTCIWGSVAGFVVLLYILDYLFHGGRIDYNILYIAVILYFSVSLILMFCAIFSRVDALYLSFLRAGRRLSCEQFALMLGSIYTGSLILFGIGFYFVAPDFTEHVHQFADHGSIRRLVGEFCMIPLLLSLVALLVSNVLAIHRGVRICKRNDHSSII